MQLTDEEIRVLADYFELLAATESELQASGIELEDEDE